MKRKIIKSLCLVLSLCFLLSFPASGVMKADIDKNGEITAADARIILRASVNLEKVTGEDIKTADMDFDGRLTAADARGVLRVSVGLPYDNNEYEILRSGSADAVMILKMDGENKKVRLAYTRDTVFTSMEIFEGFEVSILFKDGGAYVVDDTEKVYSRLSTESLKKFEISENEIQEIKNGFANLPPLYTASSVDKRNVDGKICSVYSFLSSEGRTDVIMCGSELIKTVNGGEVMTFDSVSSEIPPVRRGDLTGYIKGEDI